MIRHFISTIILVAFSAAVYGQADTSGVDSMRAAHPDEWYHQQLPHDAGPPKDSIQVDYTSLPRALQATLKRNDDYEGWEQGEIYLNRNTAVYQVHIVRDSILYVYGLLRNGQPVSFRTQKIKSD
ncbi:MAG TPA: hypothetical protein VD816_13440 [Ohtaekwangia sp.]|nr:hypothetical protein [Ohtaekwangia sp.]